MTKIVKMDESGPAKKANGSGMHDNFVMFGLMIDAESYVEIDIRFKEILSLIVKDYKFKNNEFHSKNMDKDISKRKKILSKICDEISLKDIKIFGIVISMKKYENRNVEKMKKLKGHNVNHWILCSIYNCAMIQKWIESKGKDSCRAIVFSDSHSSIKNFRRTLDRSSPWFDGLYQTRRGNIDDEHRFDRILDKKVFSDRSSDSSIIQVADAVCHIYRNYFDLLEEEKEYKDENCDGYRKWKYEYNLYKCLVEMLEEKREKRGHTGKYVDTKCVEYYESIKCDKWTL